MRPARPPRAREAGELAKMPHEVVGLPSNFADLFFRHEPSGADEEEESELTVASLDEEITALEQELEQRPAETTRKAVIDLCNGHAVAPVRHM